MAYTNKRSKFAPAQTWDGITVFAAAVVAQEINGEYLKFPKQIEDLHLPEAYAKYATWDEGSQSWFLSPNKVLISRLLTDGFEFSQAHLEKAENIRMHYQALLFEQMAGELKSFLLTALRVSGRETFQSNDWLDLAVVSSLPGCYERDIARRAAEDQRKELAQKSHPVGNIGDRVVGKFTVVQCSFSPKWNCWTVNAEKDGNLFFFFYKSQLKVGELVNLAGTVKNYRDTVTQLNRVKISG